MAFVGVRTGIRARRGPVQAEYFELSRAMSNADIRPFGARPTVLLRSSVPSAVLRTLRWLGGWKANAELPGAPRTAGGAATHRATGRPPPCSPENDPPKEATGSAARSKNRRYVLMSGTASAAADPLGNPSTTRVRSFASTSRGATTVEAVSSVCVWRGGRHGTVDVALRLLLLLLLIVRAAVA